MDSQPIALRDQLSIETPELVSIDLPIAGIGSRCLAVLLDYLLQGVAILLLALLASLLPSQNLGIGRGNSSGAAYKWGIAIVIAIPFLLHWGYFTLFEAFWQGQTPGKKMTRLRVIQQSGRALGLFESLTRNLIRFIDMIPGFYFVGTCAVFITRRQQRLGDMAAGTLVVHIRSADTPFVPAGARTFTAPAFERPLEEAPRYQSSELPMDAVSRLDRNDLQMIDNFLARRLDLPMEVRPQLARKLSLRMASKMRQEIPGGMSDETFLETVAREMREHGTR